MNTTLSTLVYHPFLATFLIPLLLLKLILLMFLVTTELTIASTHFAARLLDSLTEERSSGSVKKLGRKTLEKILTEHAQRRIDETNDMLNDSLLDQLGSLVDNVGMVKELKDNDLFRRDAKALLNHVTPYIPMIGLLCGGLIVAKHVWVSRTSDKEET